MIENTYQLISDLSCQEIEILKDKEHFKNYKARKLILSKCELLGAK